MPLVKQVVRTGAISPRYWPTPKDAGFLFRSSLIAPAFLAAPEGAFLYLNGSSYSFTLSLSITMSCFWYRFVAVNRSLIVRGLTDKALERISPETDGYIGEIFSEMCGQYVEANILSGSIGAEIGRCWGTDPGMGAQADIDIMTRLSEEELLLGICLWTREQVGAEQLEIIKWQSRIFPERDKKIYIFARSGFAEGCVEYAAESGNIHLLTFEDVMAGLA